MSVLGTTELDLKETTTNLHRGLSGRLGDRHLVVAVEEGSDRGDDRSGTAGEDLRELARAHSVKHLVDAELALHRLQAEIRGHLEDGPTGDTAQDRARQLRGDELAVLADGHEVHAAELLDPAVLDRVDEEHPGAAAGLSLDLGAQRGSVVATALRLACAAGSSTGLLALDEDAHWLHSPDEVGAHR